MSISLTTRLNELILCSIKTAQEFKSLPNVPIDKFTVERPQNAAHGDFATGVPLKLAKSMKMAPLAIAQEINKHLVFDELIETIDLKAPGFINIFISRTWLVEQLEVILRNPTTFGNSNIGGGEKLQIEFISVNPTGKLHIGHARGAIIGSALANMLKAANYKVSHLNAQSLIGVGLKIHIRLEKNNRLILFEYFLQIHYLIILRDSSDILIHLF